MKYISIISICLLIIFSSCKKETEEIRSTTCLENTESDYPIDRGMASLCPSDLCTHYLDIWKELMLERNNLNQDFFDNHIGLHYSGVNIWVKGISFSVCYEIEIDWAIAYNCDQFIIKINSDNTHYPLLDLPRDFDLTKEEIELALDNRAFSSYLAKINKIIEVVPLTIEDALNDLIEFSEVNTLCFTRLTLNKDTGNLNLEVLAKYENEDNSCISGRIDLITGEMNVLENPCFL